MQMLATWSPTAALSGVQSALDPSGPHAGAIATLSWIMFAGAALIFLVVMLLLAYALWAPSGRRWLADQRMVVAGGLVFPIVVLSALLIYGLSLANAIVAESTRAPVQIEVAGEQFWWRVRYAPGSEGAFETANEIHIPTGRPARLALRTTDVIHSLWIPNLGGKLDMIPGQTNVLMLEAERPGVYRGQCAEFCGGAHALMAFDVVVHTPESFAAWLSDQRKPAAAPASATAQRGKGLFEVSGCGACHVVRGTPAVGRIGPDLTHIGSRRSIGAASFANDVGTLARWVRDSQHLKPSNKMPSFRVFSDEELQAVATYLESLK